MTEVLEARAAYDQARADAREMVDRARARLGLSIAQARASGRSQTEVMKSMNRSREQVRAFEAAYRHWVEKHPDDLPDVPPVA